MDSTAAEGACFVQGTQLGTSQAGDISTYVFPLAFHNFVSIYRVSLAVVCPGFPQVSLEDAHAHFMRPGPSRGSEYFEAQMLLDEEEDAFNYRCPDELRATQDLIHNAPEDASSSGDDTLAEEREAHGDGEKHHDGSRSKTDRPVDKESRVTDKKELTTAPPAVVVVKAEGERRSVTAAKA